MSRVTAALAVLGACLLAAGCSTQSTKDRYIADYQPLNDRLVKVNEDLVEAINTASTASPGRFARELTPLSGEMTTLSRQIRALDTPEDLREESGSLSRRLRRTGAGVDRTAGYARRADSQGLVRSTRTLADEVNGVIRASRKPIPEQFAFGRIDRGTNAIVYRAQVEILAMSGVAEVKSLILVSRAEMDCEGSHGDRHGL